MIPRFFRQLPGQCRSLSAPSGMRGLLAAALLCLNQPCPGQTVAEDAGRILGLIDNMEQAWSAISDYSKVVEKTERLISGEVKSQTVFVKFRRPDQFYMKIVDGPGEGSELIYPSRPGSELAVAHAGGLKGGLARLLQKTVILRAIVPTEFRLDDPSIISGQHQTVPDSSLGETIRNLAANIRLAIRDGDGRLQLRQDCDYNGDCPWRLDAELPAAAGQEYVVRPGDTLWTIASEHDRPMYVILYNNPAMRGPGDLKVGQTLFIPKYYAASGSVWISAQNGLLTQLDVYDSDGRLYERYVYKMLHINPGLTDADFDTSNPEYRF